MVIHAAKLVYLHTPKTAGTAVERAFVQTFEPSYEDYWLTSRQHREFFVGKEWVHCPYSDLIRLLPFVADWFFVTSVRHPYARAISEFKYQITLNIFEAHRNPAHQQRDINMALRDGTFWKHCFEHHHRKQVAYLAPNSFVLRHETLAEDWQRLAERLNIKLAPLRIMNPSLNLNITLDDASKALLYKMYLPDFTAFGYER